MNNNCLKITNMVQIHIHVLPIRCHSDDISVIELLFIGTTICGTYIPFYILTSKTKGMQGPQVTNWVTPLIGWTQFGISWSWGSLVVWFRSIGFHGVAGKE